MHSDACLMCFHFVVTKHSGQVMGISAPSPRKHCPTSGLGSVALVVLAVTHKCPLLVQRVQVGYKGVTLSLLLQVKMLVTLPEKQGSPKTWQLPKLLDWNVLSACRIR